MLPPEIFTMPDRVAALIATYRRPAELARLLDALAGISHGLEAGVIVDNAAGDEVRAVAERSPCRTHYVAPGTNLGCGAGLKLAAEEALRLPGPPLTHLWILDDDAVPGAGTLDGLLAAMEAEKAVAAVPLVTDSDGKVSWLPGLADRRVQRRADEPASPAEFRKRMGTKPMDFHWAQGISLLVSRAAIDAHGVHRDDFWVRGEDLDFSLRLTAHGRGILVPSVETAHLPPAETDPVSRDAEYLKHAAMLQNVAYIAGKLSHGRRIAWTVPANVARFVVTWGPRSVADAVRALWRGGVKGEPAGSGEGKTFRERFARLARG